MSERSIDGNANVPRNDRGTVERSSKEHNASVPINVPGNVPHLLHENLGEQERRAMSYSSGENVVDKMIRLANIPGNNKTQERIRGFAWRNRIRQRDVMLVSFPGVVGEYPQWCGAVELARSYMERNRPTA